MFRRRVLLGTAVLSVFLLTASVAFAAQGQITEVNPSRNSVAGIVVADGIMDVGDPPGMIVADSMTEVAGPSGITVPIGDVFDSTPGGQVAGTGARESPGDGTVD